MRGYPSGELVEEIRRYYPIGARIVLHNMDDPYAKIPDGTKGTVAYVDDAGHIGVQWDNGSTLNLIPGVDSFSKEAMPKKEMSR